MLFSPVNYYCANSSRRTVLSVVFGMTRHFLKYFLQGIRFARVGLLTPSGFPSMPLNFGRRHSVKRIPNEIGV